MSGRLRIGKRIRFSIENATVAAMLAAARWLPRPVLLACGAAAGDLAYLFDRRHTRVAIDNLKLSFPGISEGEARRIARACWRHYGRITVDVAAFPRLRPDDIGGHVRYEGLDALRDAHAEGKGVLLISGHFGHWELIAYMQGFLGCPLLMITRTMENPRLEERLVEVRSGSGNQVVAKGNALRAAFAALSRGIGVAVMIDQDARAGGIFVPFFGRPASTLPTTGALHVRTGAAVVATFCYPEPDGGWRITYERLRFGGLTGHRDEDIRRITEETTALLESKIRERPELWMWMHRRWKTKAPVSDPSTR